MAQITMLAEQDRDQPRSGIDKAQVFEKLLELTSIGYVPDAATDPASNGILLRHEKAPDLILQADGTIDLPVGQPAKRPPASPAPASPQRMAKLRTLMIVMLAIGFWFLSVVITSGVLEGIVSEGM